MKRSSWRVSTTRSIVCPRCEIGEVSAFGSAFGSTGVSCDFCGRVVDEWILESLRQIVSLPVAIGSHACECGHPEMRSLPNDVYSCPGCGAEVLPLKPSRSS